jgi:hypothetical protein
MGSLCKKRVIKGVYITKRVTCTLENLFMQLRRSSNQYVFCFNSVNEKWSKTVVLKIHVIRTLRKNYFDYTLV